LGLRTVPHDVVADCGIRNAEQGDPILPGREDLVVANRKTIRARDVDTDSVKMKPTAPSPDVGQFVVGHGNGVRLFDTNASAARRIVDRVLGDDRSASALRIRETLNAKNVDGLPRIGTVRARAGKSILGDPPRGGGSVPGGVVPGNSLHRVDHSVSLDEGISDG